MVYQIEESEKLKMIKKNRRGLTFQFLLGSIVLIFNLFNRWEAMESYIITINILGVLSIPFFWIYFDKKFKKRISISYQISDNLLLVYSKDKILKYPINEIRHIKKMYGGHKLSTNSSDIYILDGISNKSELLEKLKV